MVQNSAARLLTGKWKFDHITPILSSLQWLPVKYTIEYKILLMVFKSLNGLAPGYLSDLLHFHNPSRSLRSGNLALLVLPRARLKHQGDRAFGPQIVE